MYDYCVPMTDQSIQESRTADIDLQSAVSYALEVAKRMGTTGAVAGVSRTKGYELTVRMGELETIENQNGGGLSITVFVGSRLGNSSTSDFNRTAIEDAVRAAVTIAKYTAEDPCNGLPPEDRLVRNKPDLELNFPWAIDRDRAFEMVHACEESALTSDSRIVNSEGATLGTVESDMVLANSDGLMIEEKRSHHRMSCSVVGQTKSGMQTDYWYSAARDPDALEAPQSIGSMASRRTLRRLDARRIKTCAVPVLFEAPIAGSLLKIFIGAINGGALYRKASFLLDSLGQQIFPDNTRIYEQPHLKRGLGSAVCDSEGVATTARDVVKDGVLQNYVLNSYSARKLGLETTGNAGGVFNLTIEPGKRNFDELLKLMDKGLLVTQTMGFGVNQVTGDYSQGASGFWVENGEIQYPVEELTIAGNLRDMYRSLAEVGNDVDLRTGIRTGSILLSNMAVAGE